MRENLFLEHLLSDLLSNQFADLERANKITIAFGRRAKRRFGSIRMSSDKRESRITINGIFRKRYIPEEIIKATIAHELCHYAHGFCSPLPKKYEHPHRGSVVQRELKKRALIHLHNYEKQWTKNNWRRVLEKEFPQRSTFPRRRASARVRKLGGRMSGVRKASQFGTIKRASSSIKLLFDLFKP